MGGARAVLEAVIWILCWHLIVLDTLGELYGMWPVCSLGDGLFPGCPAGFHPLLGGRASRALGRVLVPALNALVLEPT